VVSEWCSRQVNMFPHKMVKLIGIIKFDEKKLQALVAEPNSPQNYANCGLKIYCIVD
jgi:hypothetical protein